MDKTERKMTKIARELNKLTVQTSSILSIWCGTIPASHRRSCGKN